VASTASSPSAKCSSGVPRIASSSIGSPSPPVGVIEIVRSAVPSPRGDAAVAATSATAARSSRSHCAALRRARMPSGSSASSSDVPEMPPIVVSRVTRIAPSPGRQRRAGSITGRSTMRPGASVSVRRASHAAGEASAGAVSVAAAIVTASPEPLSTRSCTRPGAMSPRCCTTATVSPGGTTGGGLAEHPARATPTRVSVAPAGRARIRLRSPVRRAWRPRRRPACRGTAR